MCHFFRPLIDPQIVSGSTRQQPVGRINQAADGWDGDEDKDEIPSYAVLLTASVERFCVSRVRYFSINDHRVEIDFFFFYNPLLQTQIKYLHGSWLPILQVGFFKHCQFYTKFEWLLSDPPSFHKCHSTSRVHWPWLLWVDNLKKNVDLCLFTITMKSAS